MVAAGCSVLLCSSGDVAAVGPHRSSQPKSSRVRDGDPAVPCVFDAVVACACCRDGEFSPFITRLEWQPERELGARATESKGSHGCVSGGAPHMKMPVHSTCPRTRKMSNMIGVLD